MGTRRQFLGRLGAIAAFPATVPGEELFADETIQGVYLPGWKAVGAERLSRAERLLDRLGLNTLMVDLKDANGAVFFEAENEIGRSLQAKTADGHRRALNFTRLHALQRKGIRLLGRHVMFRDRGLDIRSEELHLHKKGSEYWVDPRLKDSVEYNLELRGQSKEFGFDEIMLDYIRFPAVNAFGNLDEKCERINEVVAEISEHVDTLGVQVFGWAAWHYRKAGVELPTARSAVLGVWQFGGIVNWRGGRPRSFVSGVGTFHRNAISDINTVNLSQDTNSEAIHGLTGRRDISGGVFWIDPCTSAFLGGSCSSGGSEGLFTLPEPGELGRLGQSIIFGPRRFLFDFSLGKRTRLGERADVEFRWEVFNAFNNTNLALPQTNITNSNFGQITGTVTEPRVMQFALKVNF